LFQAGATCSKKPRLNTTSGFRYGARQIRVGQRLNFRKIAMLSEGPMDVFPIDFSRVGFGALPSENRK